mgnify:CR=1 FL=1
MSEYHAPLFEVISGCGYKPNVKQEGIFEYNFFGTYLFGPLLVRNPHFCDYLIKKIAKNINAEQAIKILEIPMEIPAASAPISGWKDCKYHKTEILVTILITLLIVAKNVCP